MAEVLVAESAADELAELQPDIRDRMKEKLRDAAAHPDRHLKPLSGRDTHRLRAGDYRAEIDWDRHVSELRVLKIGHRDGFYE